VQFTHYAERLHRDAALPAEHQHGAPKAAEEPHKH